MKQIIRPDDLLHDIQQVLGQVHQRGTVIDLQKAAQKLETTIKSGETEKFEEDLQNLQKELTPVLDSARSLEIKPATEPPKPQTTSPAPSDVDSSTIEPLLNELSKLLKQNNLKAVSYLDSIKDRISNESNNDKIEALDNNINMFDFTNALNNLWEIADELGVSIRAED